MEEYITRSEADRLIKEEVRRQLQEQKTDEMKAINVNVGSQDVLDRLDDIKQTLERINTKQDQHSTALLSHSRSISALQKDMATKGDLTAMKEEILEAVRKISSPGGNGHTTE